MLSLSLPGRVFLCTLPTDMRRSFDALAGLVERELGQDRSRAICSSFAVGAATGSSSCTGTATAWRFGTRSRYKNAPIVPPLQNSASPPIICLSGLLELLQWMQAHQSSIQGGDPCPNSPPPLSPPRPPVPLLLDQLWNRLTPEQRQQTLATLSSVVVRQLGAPRDEKEVRNERR